MFKEILWILPKLSASDLKQMEDSLSTRFGRIAKKFGKGLLSVFAGGGILGGATALIDKLLNPLKETQEAIERSLTMSDDLVTNAKQFGTTAGKLFRLQQLAKSTGLDEGSLAILLQKFQGAIAEAAQDPKKQTSVRKFVQAPVIDPATGKPAKVQPEQDIATTFFEFIQSLQKMNKTQQVLVQQEVFGEKQVLRMADFLQTDFAKQAKLVGGPTSEQLTPGLQKLRDLNDLKDALKARQTLDDTLQKSRLITEDMIKAQARREKLELEKENQNIANYKNLSAIAETSQRIMNLVDQGVGMIGAIIVKLTDLTNTVKKLTESRAVKGIMKWIGRE